MRQRSWAMTVIAAAVFGVTGGARGDEAPAASVPAVGGLVYEVVDVQGSVRVAPTGTDPKFKAGWVAVKVGDHFRAGQQVQTGLRSKVKLVARPADPPTVLLFDRNSLINISELELKGGAARSRIQIPYGQMRAGVAEGATRSDMEIETPSATLSKKGTDIFGIEYNGNGQFRMFLTEQGRGLVQAIQTQAGAFGRTNNFRSRFLTAGQFVTHQMIRAIENVQFDRTVNVNDVFGLNGADQLFTLLNDRGLGILLNPGGNLSSLLGNNNAGGNAVLADVNQPANQQGLPQGLNNPAIRPPMNFGGGDFGIGQGDIPGLRDDDHRPIPRKVLRRIFVKR